MLDPSSKAQAVYGLRHRLDGKRQGQICKDYSRNKSKDREEVVVVVVKADQEDKDRTSRSRVLELVQAPPPLPHLLWMPMANTTAEATRQQQETIR